MGHRQGSWTNDPTNDQGNSKSVDITFTANRITSAEPQSVNADSLANMAP